MWSRYNRYSAKRASEMIVYITDCEGPIVKNDNAYELSERFIEGGDKIFRVLSAFDDYLGLFCKIEDYVYGSTLKYVVPFFLEAGLKNDDLRRFSRETMVLTKGIKGTLEAIGNLAKIYMISTSYEHFIDEVCTYLGLKRENVFCTGLNLDSYELSDTERRIISQWRKEILSMPEISWSPSGKLLGESERTFLYLKDIFFNKIPNSDLGEFLRSIKPVGGKEKARFVKEIVEKEKIPYESAIYIGDSITDTDAFQFLCGKGGLTISFNGNRYAVAKAEYVLISETSNPLIEIVDAYIKGGKDLLNRMTQENGFVFTKKKDEKIIELSERIRKSVRGEKIGSLG